MKVGTSRAAAGFAACVVLTACAALEKMRAPELEGSPESTGLVVVDSEVEVIAAVLGIRTRAKPVGGLLGKMEGEPRYVEGGVASGLVVFSGLEPGRWKLVYVEADWSSGGGSVRKTLGVNPADGESITLDVRAGEPVYVGRVKVEDDARSGSRGVRFTLAPDPGAEREAWRRLADVYADSAWAPVLRSKL